MIIPWGSLLLTALACYVFIKFMFWKLERDGYYDDQDAEHYEYGCKHPDYPKHRKVGYCKQ